VIRDWYWDNRGKAPGSRHRRPAPPKGEFVRLGNTPHRSRGGERGFGGTVRGHFPPGPMAAGRQGAQDTAAPSIRVHGMVLPSRRRARHPDPLRNAPRVRNSASEGLGADRTGRPGFRRGMGPNFRLS